MTFNITKVLLPIITSALFPYNIKDFTVKPKSFLILPIAMGKLAIHKYHFASVQKSSTDFIFFWKHINFLFLLRCDIKLNLVASYLEFV